MTSFSIVYDSFLSKITDDMYMELNELDTVRMLQQLLLSAIEKFEFPRVDLNDYETIEISDARIYNGADSDYEDAEVIVY